MYLECWSAERMWLCKGRKSTVNIEISWRLSRRHRSSRPTIASYCSITVKIRIMTVVIWTVVLFTVTCLQKYESAWDMLECQTMKWHMSYKSQWKKKKNQTFSKSVAHAWPFLFGWEETTSDPAKRITKQTSFKSFTAELVTNYVRE